MRPAMSPSSSHCFGVGDGRDRSQYQRKRATEKTEWACDHDGSRYMATGIELANHMPTVAQKAQSSPTYFLANRNDRQRPRNPYSAVAPDKAIMYGQERPSGVIEAPKRSAAKTAKCATATKGDQRMAGPTE